MGYVNRTPQQTHYKTKLRLLQLGQGEALEPGHRVRALLPLLLPGRLAPGATGLGVGRRPGGRAERRGRGRLLSRGRGGGAGASSSESLSTMVRRFFAGLAGAGAGAYLESPRGSGGAPGARACRCGSRRATWPCCALPWTGCKLLLCRARAKILRSKRSLASPEIWKSTAAVEYVTAMARGRIERPHAVFQGAPPIARRHPRPAPPTPPRTP